MVVTRRFGAAAPRKDRCLAPPLVLVREAKFAFNLSQSLRADAGSKHGPVDGSTSPDALPAAFNAMRHEQT